MLGSAGSSTSRAQARAASHFAACPAIAGIAVLAWTAVASGQSDIIPWAPSRDEAVIASQAEAIGSGVEPAQAISEELPAPNLRVQRPARLLPRGAVGRMHEQYVQNPPVVEDLPVPPPIGSGFPGGACDYCTGDGCVNCCGNWNSCGPVSPCLLLPRPRLEPLEVLLGLQGFTGPANRGGSGSFGFYEGFNHGFGLCGDCFCGQFGARWTQSNFDGSLVTPQDRTQIFATAGLFRRVDWGLQCGLVFDYLHDEWDYEVDLGQLRGEAGWKYCGCNEVGFRFSIGTNDANANLNSLSAEDDEIVLDQQSANFDVNDLFAFYYRRQFACGGEGRLFGGWTSNDQGLLGGDVRVPLSPCWSLQADFLYVIPSDDSPAGFVDETWNVAVGVVWTPFAKPGCPTYCRPLFDVANNGTFATRVQ